MITLSDVTCNIRMILGNPCGRHAYRHGRCIFHLEDKSYEETKIFEREFWQELERMEKDNDIKELDFTRFIFPEEISFKNHLFEKHVSFLLVIFIKGADFSRAQFKDTAFFSQARFIDEANFSEAQFKSTAVFFKAQFSKTDFSNVQFNSTADFLEVQFRNTAYFYLAQFSDRAYFYLAQFNEEAFFSECRFNGIANFNGTQFSNEVDFSGSVFLSGVFFINTRFQNSSEVLIRFQYCKFHKPEDVSFQSIDLRSVSFLMTDVTEIEFLDERWVEQNGRLVVIDENHIGDVSTSYSAVAQLYRQLRRNYETNYRFTEAGNFFVGEMEMRRLDVSTIIENKNLKKIVLWIKRNCSLLAIYKHLSLYGESYIRPAIFAFVVIVSYPMLMHWIFNVPLVAQSHDFLYAYIRKSAASFFQMDNAYIGERILGIPILGLLFMALKRKFERKD